MPSVQIDTASTGDNVLVAAVGAEQQIEVLAYILHGQGGTQNVKFTEDSADLTGLYSARAASTFSSGHNPDGWFRAGKGKELNINLSAATQVTGQVTYRVLRV